jgi:hypothetical protein
MACRKTGKGEIRKVLTRQRLPMFLSGASWSRLGVPGHTSIGTGVEGGTFVTISPPER